MEDPILSEERRKLAASQMRDEKGHFIPKEKLQEVAEKVSPFIETNSSTHSSKDPYPKLLSFSITNPVTYLKFWWNKIIGNEGVDFRLKVKPLTALAIVFVIGSGTFGLGFLVNAVNQTPIVKYVPAFAAEPTQDPYRDTAFTGILRESGGNYYLITGDGEGVSLVVPQNSNFSSYSGKRIFVTGRLNKETGVLYVKDISDVELLPTQSQTVPSVSIED